MHALSTTRAGLADSDSTRSWARWTPLTAIAFVVFFLGSVVASQPPADNASDQKWLAAYATHGKQVQHVVTGFLLLFAGLSLMTFLTYLWTRIAAARRPQAISALPLVAAAVSTACIVIGGIFMAGISGSMLFGSAPLPGADLLRLGNDLGFVLVGLGGMFWPP